MRCSVVAPFLELEDEQDVVEPESEDELDYADAMLEDIPLNDDEDDDDDVEDDDEDDDLRTVFDALASPEPNHGKTESIHGNHSGSINSSINSSRTELTSHFPRKTLFQPTLPLTTPRDTEASASHHHQQQHEQQHHEQQHQQLQIHSPRSGKRPRNHRRVSFPCTLHSLEDSVRFAESRSGTPPSSSHHTTSLERIRPTIHRWDYTPSEKQATWYTIADLRSFKRDRKETARLIDHGLLALPLAGPRAGIPPPPPGSPSDASSLSVYCARGCENCTEDVGRIRYRHIADGWRAVLNTQEKHNYRQQKLASMSSAEQSQFLSLASFLGSGKRSSPRNEGWFSPPPDGSDGRSSSCCPYELAAVYEPSSRSSLEIARSRAIGDEREVAEQRKEEESLSEASRPGLEAFAIATVGPVMATTTTTTTTPATTTKIMTTTIMTTTNGDGGNPPGGSPETPNENDDEQDEDGNEVMHDNGAIE